MAARKCPQCLTVISMGHAAAFTDKVECPSCKSTLEVAGASRHLAIWAGLLAGVLAWRLTSGGEGTSAWVLPVVLSFLSYSVVAAIGTMFTADLRLRPPEPVAEAAADAGHGHGGGHH